MAAIFPGFEAIVRELVARLIEAANVQARERVLAAMAGTLNVPSPRNLAGTLKQGSGGDVSKARRPLRLSAKALAVRKLQGQYLGTLRGLAPAARKRVQATAKEKGVAAAVALAKKLK
jgi:hypothetical protein